MAERIAIGLEVVDKRAFASAFDWPGWSRAGRDEAAALSALAAAAPRYAAIVRAAGLAGGEAPGWDARAAEGVGAFELAERLPGTPTTTFGAPDVVFAADERPTDPADAAVLARILEAAWSALDAIAAAAPAELRKGPRGGGRDRDEVVRHVVAAEAAYARKIGVAFREPDPTDRAAVAAARAEMVAVLGVPSDGTPVAGKRWTARYAARRIAWHVLDHAWEIEDRSEPGV